MLGYKTCHVTCNHCARTVQIDPRRIPERSHPRLRSTACGKRGATISFGWTTQEPPDNVVPIWYAPKRERDR